MSGFQTHKPYFNSIELAVLYGGACAGVYVVFVKIFSCIFNISSSCKFEPGLILIVFIAFVVFGTLAGFATWGVEVTISPTKPRLRKLTPFIGALIGSLTYLPLLSVGMILHLISGGSTPDLIFCIIIPGILFVIGCGWYAIRQFQLASVHQ